MEFPTSWAQQRLWFLEQLEGASAAYNVSVVIRLDGLLDQSALRLSLNSLVERHEMLRTTFVSIEGEPRQRIAANGSVHLEAVDLRDLGEAECMTQIDLHKREEAGKAFDLAIGPLIRGRLLQVRSNSHLLLITMHHVVCDAWSVAIMLRELAQLYEAHTQGRKSTIRPLPVQYADYAQWQRQWLEGGQLERQTQYWRARLDGAVPELELPKDRTRPPVQGYRGDTVGITIEAELSQQLILFARRREMTLFMVLYAAWVILLSWLSGQEDIVIGTPVANRRRPELEALIGFFVNTLVLRAQVDRESTVERLLKHVKEVTIAAFDHQDVPFEYLVEKLRPERGLNRHPIFQVMFALDNASESEWRLPGLNVSLEDPANETSKFDLLLLLQQRGERIVGGLNYDSDLFDRQTIERWNESYIQLLRNLLHGEDRRVGDLLMLPDREQFRVLLAFNNTVRQYDRNSRVHHLIEYHSQQRPWAVAVVHGAHSVTYLELNDRANRLALTLMGKGVGANQLVGVCMERCVDMVVAVLGILKAGGAYVPLDPHYPLRRLAHMIEDAAPRVILIQERFRDLVGESSAELLALDQWLDAPATASSAMRAHQLHPENLVYVIYTSGSTGSPKGIAMPHRAALNLTMWQREVFGHNPGTRVLQFAALSFDVAFQEIVSALCTGGTLVLIDEPLRRDAGALIELLIRQSVERVFLPPLMLQNLAEFVSSTRISVPSLRHVITAGEQLRITPEIVDFFKQHPCCELHNHYGPTETHVVTAHTLTGDPDTWPSLPSIGKPIANTQVYLLDSLGRPVPIGVIGDLFIGGENVSNGYIRRPGMTAQRFVQDPFSTLPGARMYRTGDLGRWRSDGTIEYLGRSDDQVKIRGYRVELGEIDALLKRHEGVREAVVVMREDRQGDHRLVAYLTLRPQSVVSVEELRAYMKCTLPDYMIPSAFVVLPEMPVTPSGKLDRRALPAPQLSAYASELYEPPANEAQHALAAIWRDLLGVQRIGRNDNFFELGGHSLMVLKALFLINRTFGSQLNVADVYKAPTLRELAARIGGETGEDRQIDLASEAELDKSIYTTSSYRHDAGGAVLLTGATGFVGRFLLAQLLKDSKSKVFCLTRSRLERQGNDSVKAMLLEWDLWRDEFEGRIVVVPGDLRMPGFGLDHVSYEDLARCVDVIYHCATSMNHLETYEMAKRVNVGAAKDLVRFASEVHPKVINYISTLGVFNPASSVVSRIVSEHSSIAKELHWNSRGYVASKWVAEQVFLLGQQRGIPCNIFRLGLIWADTERGRYDALQRGYRILKSCLLCGYGIQQYHFEMAPTPVDFAARAVTYLATRYAEGRGIFHVSSAEQNREGFFERCNRVADTRLELLPFYDWMLEVKRLHLSGKDLPMVPLLEYAFSMDEHSFYEHERKVRSGIMQVDCSATHRELGRGGLYAPTLDDTALRACIEDAIARDAELREHLHSRGFLKSATAPDRMSS